MRSNDDESWRPADLLTFVADAALLFMIAGGLARFPPLLLELLRSESTRLPDGPAATQEAATARRVMTGASPAEFAGTSTASARTRRVRWHKRHDIQLAVIGIVVTIVAGAAFTLWPGEFATAVFYDGLAALCVALVWFISDLLQWPSRLAAVRKALVPAAVTALTLGLLASRPTSRPMVAAQVIRIDRIAIGWRSEGAGTRLYAAVQYANTSALAVTTAGTGGTFLATIDAAHDVRIERLRTLAIDAAADQPHMVSDLGPHEKRTFTILGPLLKKAEYRRFRLGGYRFYVAGQIRATATDGNSVRREGFCRFSQGDPSVVFTCTDGARGS